MIHAAIHGKLDGLESDDALAAVVFTRLRDLPPAVIANWLATARSHLDPVARVLSFAAAPVIERPGENPARREQRPARADIVIRIDDTVVVIEAKLRSSASQLDGRAGPLARHWQAAAEDGGTDAATTALIYLTPHLAPPEAELAASAELLGTGAAKLWWLSWSSLAPILERQVATGERTCGVVAADLLAYLACVGLLRFHGWRLAPRWQHHPCWRYRRAPPSHYWLESPINNPVWRFSR